MKNRAYGFLWILLFLVSCQGQHHNLPAVQNGELDLRSWDLEKQGNVNLEGEWEFYNEQLLTPADFVEDEHLRKTLLMVPGTWNKLNTGKDHPGYGYGTYRLTIHLNRLYRQLGLKVFGATTAYKLWVNGEQIALNGVVTADLSTMKPQLLPLTRNFKPDTSVVELVVQVANNLHARGGLWDYLTLGTDEKIADQYDHSRLYDLFLIGVIFILFVYNMVIYILRTTEKAAFWFALACVALALRSLTTGERYLFYLFPNLSVNIGLRLEYFTLVAAGALYTLFLYNVFSDDFPKRIRNIVLWVNVVNGLIIVFGPTLFYTNCLLYFQLVLVLECFYLFCIVQPRAVLNKREGAIPLLVSLIFLMVCVVNDILSSRMIIRSPYFIPYGFFVTVLVQSFILARRFSRAFGTIEDLSVELISANKNLEQKVIERTHQLTEEKQKSDDLLHNILPQEVAEELKQNGTSEARQYKNVTVLFTDFVGFTKIAAQLSATELVAEIHKSFTAFDAVIEKHGLEKIKTIGDSYMAVCGLPVEAPEHAQRCLRAALDIQEYTRKTNSQFQIRIGIHSGPVVAGIVGVKKYAYDIWGDTVNTAARMEQNSAPGKINISGATYALAKNEFECEYRGKIEAKHKGEVDMYFVEKVVL